MRFQILAFGPRHPQGCPEPPGEVLPKGLKEMNLREVGLRVSPSPPQSSGQKLCSYAHLWGVGGSSTILQYSFHRLNLEPRATGRQWLDLPRVKVRPKDPPRQQESPEPGSSTGNAPLLPGHNWKETGRLFCWLGSLAGAGLS